jgi:transcriptional regulator with XRE-family HTH domain
MLHNIITPRAFYQHNSFNDENTKSVDNLRMSFGKQLAQARKRLRLTQPQLAKLCGWDSQSRISMYERGERQPSIQEVVKLSDILNVPLDNLLRDKPLEESAPNLTPQQKNLLILFNSLTEGQQKEFLEEMREAKQRNDELYQELKRKYEGGIASSQQVSTPAPERRSGEDRRQSINVVETDFRTCLDRRQDEAVIMGPGDSFDDAKARWRDQEKKQEK